MATLGTIIQSAFDPSGASKTQKGYVDDVVNSKNEGFNKASEQYGKYIDSNTGKTAYNDSMNAGKSDGSQMFNEAVANAQNKTAGMADRITQKQANGAASEALGNAVSSGMTRGRAAMDAGQTAANAYSNAYAQNYNTQLGQQNQLMGANLGQMNNQQNMYNQQLANQLNAQGTQMGAHLTNDQSQYNQGMNNLKEGKKEATGPLGWVVDAFSDEKMKDKVKIGLGDEDLRMTRYKRCGEKLKQMNPNKWNELKWEAK
jgi:hypothetical protein